MATAGVAARSKDTSLTSSDAVEQSCYDVLRFTPAAQGHFGGFSVIMIKGGRHLKISLRWSGSRPGR